MKNLKILFTITCLGVFLLTGLNSNAQSCSGPGDCDDSNICTTDGCWENNCYHLPAVMSTWNPSHVSCHGGNDGSISLMPGGGTTPYTYTWSSNASTGNSQTSSGLSAGFYTFTITDINGCSISYGQSITQPSALSLSFSVTDPGCDGISATIDLTVGGGTPSYSYNWSSSAITQDVTVNSSASPYSVTVTDSEGCTATNGVMIYEDCCVEEITHCTDVTNPTTTIKAVTIYAGGSGCTPTVDVSDDGILHLEGGSEVYLRNGFYAHPDSGGEFHAYIVPCTTGSPKRGSDELVQDGGKGISLSAFPNPFNNVVTLKYHLSEPESVNLFITDLTGKEIMRVINNAAYEAGDYSLDVSASSFADGIYLCVFKAGNYRQTQKLIKILSE